MATAESDAETVEVDGVTYRYKLDSEKEFLTPGGMLKLTRRIYQPDTGGKCHIPLDAAWGMEDQFATAEVRNATLYAVALGTPQEAETLLAKCSLFQPSATAIKQMAKQTGQWLDRPPQASGSRAIDVSVRGSTTRQHKTHGTKAEVVYPWHPWFGKEVIIDRAMVRRDRSVFWCHLTDDDCGRMSEVPQWMFDRAVCCVMRRADSPRVSCRDLRRLRDLLRQSTALRDGDVIQSQHPNSFPKGDADAKDSNSSSRDATEPIPTPTENAVVAAASCRRQAENDEPAGSSAARASSPTPRKRKRRGGDR